MSDLFTRIKSRSKASGAGCFRVVVLVAALSFTVSCGAGFNGKTGELPGKGKAPDPTLSPDVTPTSLPPPVAGAIIVSTFDGEGMIQISAAGGTVVGGATVVILDRTNGKIVMVIAGDDGSFEATLEASTGDILEIYQIVGKASSTSTTVEVKKAKARQISAGLHGGFEPAGGKHTCALMDDSTVRCWGKGDYGQLGFAWGGYADSAKPVFVSDPSEPSRPLTGVVQISVGARTNCALLDNTQVVCWGFGAHGILGDGDTADHKTSTPVRVKENKNTILSGVVYVSVGSRHACALMTDTSVMCWGNGNDGKLGDNIISDHNNLFPTRVFAPGDPKGSRSLTGVKKISAGAHHTCALMNDGTVMCWGDSHYGKLANGCADMNCDEALPVAAQGVADAMAVYAADNHTCALLSNKTAKCWGTNREGQLGNISVPSTDCDVAIPSPCDSAVPVEVLDPSGSSALSPIGSISANTYHSCALLGNGGVRCWGNGNLGGLGDGDTTNHEVSLPVDVAFSEGGLLSGVIQITSGFSHSCALLETNQVQCWGDKYLLGTGNFLGMTDSGQEGLGYPVDVLF